MITSSGRPHIPSSPPPDEADRWTIELLAADEEGCRFYLEHYKPFRLEALQQDPDGTWVSIESVSLLPHPGSYHGS